jgi:hypothetical protein
MKITKQHTVCMRMGLVLVAVISSVALGGEPKVKKQDPTVFFWYHFRTAVIQNNLPKLKELTHFPFETTAADGTVTKTPRASFATLFHPLLGTPVAKGQTMRDLITAKEDLTNEERVALKEREIQIGSFRFRTEKNVCYFVGASLSPDPSRPPPPTPAVPAVAPVPSKKTKPVSPVAEPTPRPAFSEIEEEPLENLAASPPKQKHPPPSIAPVLTPEEDPAQSAVFRFYWAAFRQAALDNDVEKIKSLTKFPFETKGPLEGDKKKKHVGKEFNLLWPRLLETDPHSWGPLRDSMKELIERREEPSVEEIATERTGEVKVGIFIFRKIKTRWLFTRAIIPE